MIRGDESMFGCLLVLAVCFAVLAGCLVAAALACLAAAAILGD